MRNGTLEKGDVLLLKTITNGNHMGPIIGAARIATRLGHSEREVRARLRKLESSGVLRRQFVVSWPKRSESTTGALIMVQLNRENIRDYRTLDPRGPNTRNPSGLRGFRSYVKDSLESNMPEGAYLEDVVAYHDSTYHLGVHMRAQDTLAITLVVKKISSFPSVTRTSVSLVMPE